MNTHPNTLRCLIAFTILGTLGSVSRADSIGRQLQRRMPQIVQYLNDHDYKTVGVLKFRVKKPGEPTSDSVGPLNSLLADRLELGLILAIPFEQEDEFQIIRYASDQVALVEGASHLSSEGRRSFFGPAYQLAWGEKSATADAFLTGVVQVHEGNQRASIGILCFNKNGGGLERVCDVFEANLDADVLRELGESYIVLRGAFDQGAARLTAEQREEQQQTFIRKEVAKVKTQQSTFPLLDPTAPISLVVKYDGQPVPFQIRGGKAYVPEPNEGQQIEMVLTRGPNSTARLGIVLKVNGQNTLYRQTKRDVDCAKWILAPDRKQIVVRGYQIKSQNAIEQFKVLSEKESAARAMDYGRSLGLIQLTVFEEMKGPAPTPKLLDRAEDEDLIAMLRGVHPGAPAKSLGALKYQLRNPKIKTRGGLIEGGQRGENKVKTVQFDPNPIPTMSATITYYTP